MRCFWAVDAWGAIATVSRPSVWPTSQLHVHAPPPRKCLVDPHPLRGPISCAFHGFRLAGKCNMYYKHSHDFDGMGIVQRVGSCPCRSTVTSGHNLLVRIWAESRLSYEAQLNETLIAVCLDPLPSTVAGTSIFVSDYSFFRGQLPSRYVYHPSNNQEGS